MGTTLTVVGGTVVKFSGAFSDLNTKQPADPAALAFSFAAGGGTPTVYRYGVDGELVKDSVGNYHVEVDTTDMADPGNNIDLVGQFDANAEGGDTIQVTGYAEVLVTAPPLSSPFD